MQVKRVVVSAAERREGSARSAGRPGSRIPSSRRSTRAVGPARHRERVGRAEPAQRRELADGLDHPERHHAGARGRVGRDHDPVERVALLRELDDPQRRAQVPRLDELNRARRVEQQRQIRVGQRGRAAVCVADDVAARERARRRSSPAMNPGSRRRPCGSLPPSRRPGQREPAAPPPPGSRSRRIRPSPATRRRRASSAKSLGLQPRLDDQCAAEHLDAAGPEGSRTPAELRSPAP